MHPSRFVASRLKPSPGKRRPASFGVLTLCLLIGAGTFAACGDDGNLIGSDGSAGNMAQTGGSAAAGHAGSTSNAGKGGTMSAGGTTSTGGTVARAGSGTGGNGTGGATCALEECLRANVCLDECGGNVVYTGCCACPESTVEQLTCGSGGSGGSGGESGGGGGGDSAVCPAGACAADETCVGYRTVGGAAFPLDTNGMCDPGRHAENSHCQPDFAYTCVAVTCSTLGTSCRCPTGSECAQANTCRLPNNESWVDGAAELLCEQQVP